ncbi:MAG: hypothetical protein ACOCWM_01060 [Cyclobacteriaceae bacterium]
MANQQYERLEQIAKQYFGNLSNMAIMLNKHRSFFYAYKSRDGLGAQLLNELKDTLAINPHYLKTGLGKPFVLDGKNFEEFMQAIKKHLTKKSLTNVAEVSPHYSVSKLMPDIKNLTLTQMKEILDWADENIPKIKRILNIIEDNDDD